MRFYSQVGQDRYLLENFFRGKRNGTFLDVGAYDGEKFSNTLFFEQTLGWKGLCIEPLPSAYQKLAACRSSICENVAVSNFTGASEFVDCDSGVDEKMLSGLANQFDPRHVERLKRVSTAAQSIKVPVTTLSALLEKHSLFSIDFASIDAEGAELSILEGLDTDRFHVSLFSIENNYDDERLQRMMESRGYEFVARLEQDYVFKRKDVARLPRTSVICSVWHGDPDRLKLLRGHQANLARQTVPIDPIYVFDGGDKAPAWLKAKSLSVKQSLSVYQAWNVALSLVETPLVMNLNLDDRLAPDAVATLELNLLKSHADAIGGDWNICYTQTATDKVAPCYPAETLPFVPDWPPAQGTKTRLGSGTHNRGTFGPATMWRMDAHMGAPRYPWRTADGTVLRTIGDAAWWLVLQNTLKKKTVRLPMVIGNYHSHPSEQAEFRPNEVNEELLLRSGIPVSLL